jgi:para-aminobenzoate synthetase component 1
MFQPVVRIFHCTPNGGFPGCREYDRMEWRIGDGGDAITVATRFLEKYRLGLPMMSSHRHEEIAHGYRRPEKGVEATLFLSAAAAAHAIGAPVGAPSPAPDIPDLVIVVRAGPSDPEEPASTGWAGVWAGPASSVEPASAGPAEPTAGGSAEPTAPWRIGPWEPSWTPAAHADAVAAARAAIAAGDVYQVNVVGHLAAPYQGDPGPALRRLAHLPGARHAGVLTGDGWALACASPETLLRVEGDVVETRPIKGTAPATEEGLRQLRASTKERAEHVMIVDLSRNDLARVAVPGTVTVPSLYAVRRWCDLWQAESRVVARLNPKVGLADVLAAVCPGGSVTGAPKLAALAQIAALEPVGRGPSMGVFGRISPTRLDLGLTIRTVGVDRHRVHVWAGGGITWDSDPAAEVAEAAAKAHPLLTTLSPAAPPTPRS